jgi:hypothetical protein
MAKATKKYTLEDLDWLEAQLKSMKQFIEAVPVDQIKDRTTVAMSAKGTPVIKMVASIEQILTARLKLTKEIAQQLMEIERLREEKAVQEVEVRGGGEINLLMKNKLQQT